MPGLIRSDKDEEQSIGVIDGPVWVLKGTSVRDSIGNANVGLDTPAVMLLSGAKALGVDFARTAMIGRQSFWPDVATLRRVFTVHKLNIDAVNFLRDNPYGERFLALLGAQEISSLDYSTYEQSSLIHDMNTPIPTDWHERYSAVFDGGTIEHVFNIPQAFKNCLDMVQVGGHFVQVGVANNYLGHSFWQFSPELLFRILSPTNGYHIKAVLMHEVVPGGSWYRVRDPAVIKTRVELCNRRPTYILTVAQRVASCEIFAQNPQQSDYLPMWSRTACPAAGREASRRSMRWRSRLPLSIKRELKQFCNHFSLFGQGWGQPCYQQIDADAVIRGEIADD